MIKNIRGAFKDNVKKLDWMDEQTKKAVEEKVTISLSILVTQNVGTVDS